MMIKLAGGEWFECQADVGPACGRESISAVGLRVFDARGREVACLVCQPGEAAQLEGRLREAGRELEEP